MSAREVILNAIPPQFNDLPFQIPPTNPVVQPYITYISDVITIPANTEFLTNRIRIDGADISNKKVVVSCHVEDGGNFDGSVPFGISTWVEDTPNTDILVSFWNASASNKDVRAVIVCFTD
jgi:hypothetical protein